MSMTKLRVLQGVAATFGNFTPFHEKDEGIFWLTEAFLPAASVYLSRHRATFSDNREN